jgi:uncharacterized protein YcbX
MAIVVTGLCVYPVKSCRGIALDRASIEARGIRHDRRWLIVDAEGRFVTQRTEPRLALVDVAVADALVLSAPGTGVLRLPLEPRGDRLRVIVWNDVVDAIDCGAAAARWASSFLGAHASLVYMPDHVRRPVKPAYARPDDIVGFADAFPLLLASTASLDDLNARMTGPVPMDRFRPNVVVSGARAWAEDDWKTMRAGGVTLRVVKPSDRCTIPTVDQRTGERGVEPLRTLATFRRIGNDVYFAQNCIPDGPGTIAVGDEVSVS